MRGPRARGRAGDTGAGAAARWSRCLGGGDHGGGDGGGGGAQGGEGECWGFELFECERSRCERVFEWCGAAVGGKATNENVGVGVVRIGPDSARGWRCLSPWRHNHDADGARN